jgi:hypothetical protein
VNRSSGFRCLPFARRPLLGTFLFLLGLFGFAGRSLLFLVGHDTLPYKYAQANMLRTRGDSTCNLQLAHYCRFVHRLAATSALAKAEKQGKR